jgi:hypothetical protein
LGDRVARELRAEWDKSSKDIYAHTCVCIQKNTPTNKKHKNHNTSTSTQNKYKLIHSQTCGCNGLVAVKTPPAKNSEWVTCDDDDGVVMNWIITLKILSIDDVDVVDDNYTDDDDGDDNESDNDNKKSKSSNEKKSWSTTRTTKSKRENKRKNKINIKSNSQNKNNNNNKKEQDQRQINNKVTKNNKKDIVEKHTTTPLAYAPVPDSGWHDASTTALT